MVVGTLDADRGMGPAVAAAISELTELKMRRHPRCTNH